MAVLNLRVALLLVALLTATFVFLRQAETTAPGADRNETRIEARTPDVYGENVTVDQFRANGLLHYRLAAESIRQYQVERLTRMVEPDLHLRSNDQPPWDIDSRSGFIRTDTSADGTAEDLVYLQDDVTLVQDHPNGGVMTLKSSRFYIYPERQFAHTDQGVIIDSEVGRTTAAGLDANLANGRLHLKSSLSLAHDVVGEGEVARDESKPDQSKQQRVRTIVLPEQFKPS